MYAVLRMISMAIALATQYPRTGSVNMCKLLLFARSFVDVRYALYYETHVYIYIV